MPTKQHIDVSQSATMEKSQMLKTTVKWNGCLGSDQLLIQVRFRLNRL